LLLRSVQVFNQFQSLYRDRKLSVSLCVFLETKIDYINEEINNSIDMNDLTAKLKIF
jgi:hypothetical protein